MAHVPAYPFFIVCESDLCEGGVFDNLNEAEDCASEWNEWNATQGYAENYRVVSSLKGITVQQDVFGSLELWMQETVRRAQNTVTTYAQALLSDHIHYVPVPSHAALVAYLVSGSSAEDFLSIPVSDYTESLMGITAFRETAEIEACYRSFIDGCRYTVQFAYVSH